MLSTASPIKGEEVDDLRRAHAELVHHAGFGVVAAAAHGVDQGDARAHQLGEVLVAGGDRHFKAFVRALHGQRADHVVGLYAAHAQDPEAQRLHDLAHRLDLRTQVVGHGLRLALYCG
jgi:hypothetical protein